jgi:Peptidase family S41
VNKLKVFFVVVTSLFFCNVSGQHFNSSTSKKDTKLSKEDFAMFKDSISAWHPGLYRYQTKQRFNHLFDSCNKRLNQNSSLLEFFGMLKFMISSIKDGHTSCNLPQDVIGQSNTVNKLFPVILIFINNHVYVRCTYSSELTAGTEILAIDNIPVATIRKRLFIYLPSDGSIKTHKYAELNNNNFPFLYDLVFGKKTCYKITYAAKDHIHKFAIVQAKTSDFISCPSFTKQVKFLELEYIQSNIALLTVRTFSEYRCQQIKKDFKGFLDSSFKAINTKKITSLVIDLRNNGGGEDEYGSLLYSYLTDKSFRYYETLKTTQRLLDKNEDPNLQIVLPSKNPYLGKVFFLTNGNSFSTTAEFCAIAKSNDRGVFIGEETGGGYYGNTSGTSTMLTLPHTKIKVEIPMLKYVMAVKPTKFKDRGIIPNYIVVPSINDILTDHDSQLEQALNLARK